jgi:hypothetical protein
MLVQRVTGARDLVPAIRDLEAALPLLLAAQDATFVTGTRRPSMLGPTMIEPIGKGAALVVRRLQHAPRFGPIERATLAGIASAIAPTIDRLLLDHAFASALP